MALRPVTVTAKYDSAAANNNYNAANYLESAATKAYANVELAATETVTVNFDIALNGGTDGFTSGKTVFDSDANKTLGTITVTIAEYTAQQG